MAALRAGLAIRGLNPAESLAAIVNADERGLPMVWSTVGGTNPDAVTVFAAAAAKTRAIGMGTAIVPTYPRHPLVLASQVLVLESLAPGRFRLGIGPSHRTTIESMFGLRAIASGLEPTSVRAAGLVPARLSVAQIRIQIPTG